MLENTTNNSDIVHHNLELLDYYPDIIVSYMVIILSKDKKYLLKESQNIIRE